MNKAQNVANRTHNAADMLRSYVDRIVRLEEEKRELSQDIKEVFEEAKANGFDKNALKIVVKKRLKPLDESLMVQANIYLESLGELPLFAHAS